MKDMTAVLQVGDRTITADEIVPLLTSYQMLPRLLVEVVIDRAIAPITCTPEETADNYQQFCQQHQISSDAERQAWLQRYHMNPEQLAALATRSLRIEKFKQVLWGNKVESYFLSCKSQLDRVIYSLIRTQDMAIAQELYFRILEKEQSFVDLAREYSHGSEAQTGGCIGPVELGSCHPTVAKMLSVSQPGQLWTPIHIGEWVAIVRLEKLIPAQLDQTMRQRLLNDMFAEWLQKQLNQLSDVIPQLVPATLASR